jgi:alkylhydroperoxidase family enzyme
MPAAAIVDHMTNSPRIPPLASADWPAEIREILTADLGEGSPLGAATLGQLNLFTTVARHPGPFKPWLLLGRSLLMRGALPFADRELLILRVARNTGSEYEWGQHVKIVLDGGIDRATVDRVAAGPEADGWDERSRLLLCAADELRSGTAITDSTWAGLTAHLDERQLIELPLLVGYYTMVAYTLNALAVEPEAGLESLPS